MATARTTAASTAAARLRAQQAAQAAQLRQQQLGMQAQLPQGLVSPYTGTSPVPTLGAGVPTLTGAPAGMAGTVLPGSTPQLNATNQTALAPNGDVNQTVTNENTYTNKYYNIIMPYGGMGGAYGGSLGGWGGLGSSLGLGGWNTPGHSFIDPKTGVLYVQQEKGFTGWLKRLFRGY